MAGNMLFPKITDPEKDRERIRRAAWGMIEASGGAFRFIQLRPWPRLVSGIEAMWVGGWSHRRIPRDRFQLWYNQPLGHPRYLALVYAVSGLGTTSATVRAGLRALDVVARVKSSDAILCQASNRRLTDRVMRHWGFERHLHDRRTRHYIRRFYGKYPDVSAVDEMTSAAATQ